MTIYFWFAVMGAISSCWLIWFIYRPLKSNDIDLDKSNVDLGKRKQSELKQDLANDMIDSNQFNQANSEITRTLAQELNQTEQTIDTEKYGVSIIGIGIILSFLLIFSFGIYQLLSEENTVSDTVNQQEQQPLSLEQSVKEIKLWLLDKPEDDLAWASLGSTYAELAYFDEALESYEKSYQLNPSNPMMLSEYASALFFANDQKFNQRSVDLLKEALEIDSTLPFALYQMGLFAASIGDFNLASTSWKRALMSIPAGNPDRQFIEELLAQLDAVMEPEPIIAIDESEQESYSVNVQVLISEKIIEERSDNDYLMIYVKSAQGRPMPIAIQKMKLMDFLGEITLTDLDSVMPNQKLSQSKEVIVVVRVSESGSAIRQESDIQIQSDVINVRDNPVVNLNL
jgi:cytochrome c-type biogenesis protein CcmH